MSATRERLQEYYAFDTEVLDAVTPVADQQLATDDYRSFVTQHVLGGASETELRRARFLDIQPHEHDPKAALMIHLAMGQPLDPNNLYQIAAIAAANPNTRILTAPNPSGPAYAAPKFTAAERKAIAGGDFKPVVTPLLRFAEDKRIESLNQYGYSFGADLAMEAAANDVFETPRTVVIEPASVVKRSLLGLGMAFASSNAALKDYVAESGPAFKAARKESLGMLEFNAGLARLSNLAIARGLSHEGFELRATTALDENPSMKATIAWGSKSELANHDQLVGITDGLQYTYGPERFHSIVLADQKHALANDVFLQAAIVSQGLRA